VPHIEIGTGSQSATFDGFERQLIPGIEPGGSRAGEPMKPALLIQDAYIEIVDIATMHTEDFNQALYAIKLSQEQTLDPGLLLPLAQVGTSVTEVSAVGQRVTPLGIKDLFHAQNTLWAAKWLGIRMFERGTIDIDVSVHIDYEQVEVPFWDWFMMWEFLDRVPNNQKDY